MPRHPRNFGVKKRGKRWQANPYIVGQKRRVWAGTFDTEREAREAAVAKMDQLRRLPAHRETVKSFAARWVRDFPKPKQSTMDLYHSTARKFAAEFEGVLLRDFDRDRARRWATAHPTQLGAIRAMFGDAMRDGLILSNPFAALRLPRGKGRRSIIAITDEELDLVAELALKAHDAMYGPIFRSMVVFAAYVGLRPSETCGLDRADIDFNNEQVHIRRQFHKARITSPKNGNTRTVFLPPPAGAVLQPMFSHIARYWPEPPRCPETGGQILFPGKHQQRIRQPQLSGYWSPVRSAFEAALPPERAAELRQSRNPDHPEFVFHELRHFCATYLRERGVESWIIARQLGHKDGGRMVELLYGHPRDEVARQRLRQVFGQNVTKLKEVSGD